MVNQAIKKAIEVLGSQQKLAEVCGVKQPSVWAWLHNKAKVSPEHVVHIERVTNGEIPGYMIRPDLPHMFKKPN